MKTLNANWCPPAWAVLICVFWIISTILLIWWPFLAGSPTAAEFYPYAATGSLFFLILVERVVLLQRWAFFLLLPCLAAAILFEATAIIAFRHNELWLLPLIWSLAALAANLLCIFSRTDVDVLRSEVQRVATKSAFVGGVIAVMVAAIVFDHSFSIDTVPGDRIATRSEITGLWYGTHPTNRPLINAYVLTLLADGQGTFKRYKWPGHGMKVRWLLRGKCLHLALGNREESFCPVLAPDAHALFLKPGQLWVSTFKRDPYDVITGNGE